MKLTIAYNEEKNGIEFFFTPSLEREAVLYKKLLRLGFKQSFKTNGLWFTTNLPSYNAYLKELQIALAANTDPIQVAIEPSYEPSSNNIDHGKFSYVTIYYTKKEKEVFECYVLFDSHVNVATDIAERFGHYTYGKNYLRVDVIRRGQKRKCRDYLDEKKIIGASPTWGNGLSGQTLDTAIKQNAVQLPSLQNEHGVYTEETAGERYETITIPFPKIAKYGAAIRIVQDEKEQFRYGVSQFKEFGDHSSPSSPVSNVGSTYPTKEEAIREGLREIANTIRKHIATRDNIISSQEQKNKYLKKALDTVLAFGVAYGIDLETEDTTAIKKPTVLTEVSRPTYSLKQSWTLVDEKLMTQFEDFVNTNSDFLRFNEKKTEEGTMEISGVYLRSDKDEISFELRNKKELHISAHLILEENVNYGGSTISNPKLKKALTYMLQYPERLVAPKVERTKMDTELLTTASSEIKSTPIPTPEFSTPPSFVFIPEGIPKPFDSGAFKISDKTWIAENFPELYKFNDNNLSTATAQQLFMIMQFSHPNEFDIPVLRSTLLRHWEAHGKELFETLGYPTNSQALYANRYVDYTNISRLEKLLGNNPDHPHYWSVATKDRPISDPVAAIKYIENLKDELLEERLQYADPKTQKPKSNKEDTAAYRELTWKLENYEEAITLLKTSLPKPVAKYTPSKTVKSYVYFSPEHSEKIRIDLKEKRLPMPFTGVQAWEENYTPLELIGRWGTVWNAYETSYEMPLQLEIDQKSTALQALKGKRTKAIKTAREDLQQAISYTKKLLHSIEALVHDEFLVFQDELFEVLLGQTKAAGYELTKDSLEDFKEGLMPQLLEDLEIELYANEPIQSLLPKLLEWYFEDAKLPSTVPPANPFDDERLSPDYMVKIVAIMSNNYMDAKRLSKGKVEQLMEETQAPNLGMLWEAVELSWLIWYKMYYSEWISFENRLGAMIRFWNKVQPTYAYSDSSKELYKQYSTPCPIGAMIAQYTQMDSAASIFEPSAGNGLLLVGAKPEKCLVNEIDKNRRQSLLHQQFKKITHWNAAEPFPEELTKSFDVMVTNPPFAKWEEDPFDKERVVHKYFDKHRGLEHHLRLEHLMSGLALHTLKDNGKAALIIMGHITFEEDTGYISRYRPFLNWLYRNYRVADIMNLNSYKLYNKQGAVREVMLILIDGRKKTPSGAAPKFKDAPHLEHIEDDFGELWQRIKSHIKTPLEKLVQQLKIISNNDIF